VDGESRQDGDAESDALAAKVELPSSPSFPPPPDIHFERPSTERFGAASLFRRDDPASNPDVADGSGGAGFSRLGAGVAIGATLPACIVVGACLGRWLDERFNPGGAPIGTVVMTLAGIGAAALNIKKMLKMLDDRGKKH
jgi:F0F1-type ATP synthase assembly protein I